MAQYLGLSDAIGELKDFLSAIYYKKFGNFQRLKPLKKLLKTVKNTILYMVQIQMQLRDM